MVMASDTASSVLTSPIPPATYPGADLEPWSWFSFSPTAFLVGISCALLCAVILIRRARFVSRFKDIPGPKALPVLGNVKDLLGSQADLYKFYSNCFKEYGDIYVVWVGTEPFIFIGSPETVQPLLSSSQCINKSPEYDMLHDWLGTGLVTSSGEKWHHRRKLLTPSFHFKLLETFIKPAKDMSDIFIHQLKKEVGRGEFDICAYSKLIAVDLIAETAMGFRLNAQINSSSDFVKSTDTLASIQQRRFMTPWLKVGFIYNLTEMAKQEKAAMKIVHDLRDKIVKERRAVRQQIKIKQSQEDQEDGGKTRLSLLDFMLDINMSDAEIGEEVDTFMFAGHDTVATVINWSLFVLADHKDAQNKIVKEFEDLCASTDDPYSMTNLNKLDYLDRCLKEVMRLYSPVPLIARRTSTALRIGGHYVPAETRVLVFFSEIHMNPKNYLEPEKFDPDRFLPERRANAHPFSYVPFSAGYRNCIGSKYAMLVLKIILLKVLQAYEISTNTRPEDLRLYSELVLANENGVNISIEKRLSKS